MKEILQQRMFEDNTYKTHEVHNDLYEALQNSVELDYSNQRLADQEEARKKKRKTRESPRTPPGSPPTQPPLPPPPAGASDAPGTSGASGSSQLPPSPPPLSTSTSGFAQQQGSQAPSSSKIAASTLQSMAWTTSDTQYESADIHGAHELSPTDYLIQDDSIPEEQQKDRWKPLPEEERPATPKPAWVIPSSNVSDVENNWASALVSISETPTENSLLAKTRDRTTFMKWHWRQVNKTKLTQADFEGQAYEVVKAFYPDIIHLQFQMEECHKMLTYQIDWTNPEGDQVRVNVNQPLPLGGPPGHVTIQPQFFFNKDLEYLRYGSKGSNPALSIYSDLIVKFENQATIVFLAEGNMARVIDAPLGMTSCGVYNFMVSEPVNHERGLITLDLRLMTCELIGFETTRLEKFDDDVPNFEAMISAAVANALPNLTAALRTQITNEEPYAY
ncbi:hypothetical protein Tco_0494412 [Tanacetum coccineum]